MTNYPWSSIEGDIPINPNLNGFLVGELVHKLRSASQDVLVDARLADATVAIRVAGYLDAEDWPRVKAVVAQFVSDHATHAQQLSVSRNGDAELLYLGPTPTAITRAELSTLYFERTRINTTIAMKEAQLAMQEAACTSKESYQTQAAASTPLSSTAEVV